jgi:hypothetical protein
MRYGGTFCQHGALTEPLQYFYVINFVATYPGLVGTIYIYIVPVLIGVRISSCSGPHS